MEDKEMIDRIIAKLDPEELIDMLDLDIEYLTHRLKIEVLEALEEGKFDYLEDGG